MIFYQKLLCINGFWIFYFQVTYNILTNCLVCYKVFKRFSRSERINKYSQRCSQINGDTIYGMGTQIRFGQKSNTPCSFVICFHLMNFEFLFSCLVVSRLPSNRSVSCCFCILSETLSLSRLLHGWAKKR